MFRRMIFLNVFLLIASFAMMTPTDVHAQKKGPAPVVFNPAAPSLNLPFPSGGQRGKAVDIMLSGTNLAGPAGVAVGFPAKVTVPTEDKNGQDQTKVKVRLEIAGDAPVGYYPLRYASTRGVSNLRMFCVDELPSVIQNEKNRSKETAQDVPVPCVIEGRTAAEAADYYKFTVKAGDRLAFDVLGRRLGGPIDPQIALYHAKSGREITYNNDFPGAQSDPRLAYTFKEAGDYVLEVKDILNRGGADYLYRIRVGDFPLAVTPYPMTAKRGSKLDVKFTGPDTEAIAPVAVAVPTDPSARVVWVAPKGKSGLLGWPVALAISDDDETVEQNPNNVPEKATRITVPGGVTGRFEKSNETDHFIFTAKKGQKITIEGDTLELYSPSLLFIVLKNAKTKAVIAKSNPDAAPPADQRFEFTAAEDGDYLLEVQHLHFAGGPTEVYHVSVTTPRNTFELSVLQDRIELASGVPGGIPINVARKGYNGPIEVSLVGAGPLTATTTIKEGQNSGILPIEGKGEIAPASYSARVIGKATIDGKAVAVEASTHTLIVPGLAGLTYPPLQMGVNVGVGVREKAPFSINVKMDPLEGVPGIGAKFVVTAQRAKDFAEEIVLQPIVHLPPNVPAPKLANIAKDKNEISFPIDLNAKATMGTYPLFFLAKAKGKDKEFVTSAAPFNLVLGAPFDLKVDPNPVALMPGGKGKVKVVATRRGNYKGPISLEVRKLPPMVSAGKAIIPEGKNEIEIDVAVDAKAAPADKTDVDVNGTATALNNLQNATPVFTVRIGKK